MMLPTEDEITRGFERLTEKEKLQLLMRLIGGRSILANVLIRKGASEYAYVTENSGGALVYGCAIMDYDSIYPGTWKREA